MKTTGLLPIRVLALALIFGATKPIQAGFDGPYSLTPPTPDIYRAGPWPMFGNWTASGISASVNTLDAPVRLQLEVPTGSIFANMLQFQTRAAASGMVRFDCATVTCPSNTWGFIHWFRQPAGTNATIVRLDQGVAGQFKHFEFEVQAGDTFGFRLESGSDALQCELPTLSLAVQNFVAPLPAPRISAVSFRDGNLALSGTNGIPKEAFYVLAATDAAAVLANWSRVSTNVFDDNGNFSVTIPVKAGTPASFFILQRP